MKAHDRFESLAGAVALGEATESERVEFVAHAQTCALCRDDAFAPETSPLAAVAAARAFGCTCSMADACSACADNSSSGSARWK